jgi:hypothetical protein
MAEMVEKDEKSSNDSEEKVVKEKKLSEDERPNMEDVFLKVWAY